MVKADYILKVRDDWRCELREADTEQEADLVGVELEDVRISDRDGATGCFAQEISPQIKNGFGTFSEAVVYRTGFSFLLHEPQQLDRLIARSGKRINIKVEHENTST